MKKILLLMMAVAMVAMSSSATKIYVCGTKITGTTSFSAGGGTVSYDNSTHVLNIYNVDYTKSGSSNNGISVDDVDGDLTINLTGTVKFTISDADAVLCKDSNHHNTYINVSGTATFTSKSSGHAGLKLQGCDVYLKGSGSLTIENTNTNTSADAIKGGTGNENLTFQIKNCSLNSKGPRLYHLNKVSFFKSGYYDTGDYTTRSTTIKFNTGSNTVHASDISEVYNPHTGTTFAPVGVHIFLPIEKFLMNLKGNLTSTSMANTYMEISDYVPDVIINTDRIPNSVLRAYLLSLYSKGYLTKSESQARTSLTISGMNISSLSGIEQFKYLTELNCSNNSLSQFGFNSYSYLPSTLKKLNCSNNQFSSLEWLPTNLEYFNCAGNKFTTLNTMSYTKLYYLDCSNNTLLTTLTCNNQQLTTLLVSGCTSMTSLNCAGNKLTSLTSLPSSLTYLNVSNNQLTSLGTLPSSLQHLYCSSNKFSGTFSLTGRSALKTLDISHNPSITTLNCYQNALTSLNVSVCSSLTSLNCYNNQLTSLGNLPTSLQSIDASTNKLSGSLSLNERSALRSLFLSNNPNLTSLYCYSNSLTYLDVANCSALTTLQCYSNKLSTLSITGCSALATLDCHSNQLTSLTNIPTSVQTLNCSSNKLSGTLQLTNRSALKSVDISSNPNLSTVNIYSNSALTSLNVQNCTALTSLLCNNNQLTSLDVSTLSNLSVLSCGYNKLSSLNVSNKTKLTKLLCNYNQLTSLNVQGCSALTNIDCGANKLSSLSVQGCSSLTELNCCLNQIKESGANTLVSSLRTIRNL